ncbi:hypothetical protein OTK49_00495 [Vibrio coralliirubri]|uniref:hypothetical protein n=1 Tax=Vibrio coralliirubri TaxID=1516159 RepID=UPI0022848C98|nr:hypothetical protein [Vibrio coralliirubri]MCY9861020.1 hypothetical protein [Vibrio coralliirubri]
MTNKDLRKEQRAKHLEGGVRKPQVTLTAEKSREASIKSIELISVPWVETCNEAELDKPIR